MLFSPLLPVLFVDLDTLKSGTSIQTRITPGRIKNLDCAGRFQIDSRVMTARRGIQRKSIPASAAGQLECIRWMGV